MSSGPGRKMRFYPTEEQEALLVCELGVSRWIWNWLVGGFRFRRECKLPENVSLQELEAEFREFKNSEHGQWLSDVSSVTVQQTFQAFERARNDAMGGSKRWPRFRSKKHTEAGVRYVGSAITYEDGQILVAKIPGNLDIRWSYARPNSRITSLVIKRTRTRKWFISFADPDLREVSGHSFVREVDAHDLGVKTLVTSVSGSSTPSPRFGRQADPKLQALQRKASKQKKGGKNKQKTLDKIARLYETTANKRSDYLHKMTTKMARENQVNILECLNVLGMVASAKGTVEEPGTNVKQKSGLNKAILDCSFGEIMRQLTYKTEWYGGTLVKVDQWFASSKLCSDCGQKNTELTLDQRSWICVACEAEHDRDYNASWNLLVEGLRMLSEVRGKYQKKYQEMHLQAQLKTLDLAA